ncbi:hypothetical protein HH303_17750 [Rhodospirillaceae bacterium KN72]|uniref:O-GlcNAc transferase C-terminal domain-containing protein n=1 Tax=Pacificispira spongiicola TaxID=2729598 RepID=A0A7Y0HFX9_9PROT|nr:glycosyltransferase family 41 protein [Pacificispira spongiicola]NMM46340.1 hypothetical protein [Pacificispira spongiicola]
MSDDSFSFDLDLGNLGLGMSLGDSGVHRVLTHLTALETEEALGEIQKLRDRDGASPLVQHLLALAVTRMGRPVPAIQLLEAAHEQAPSAYEHAEVLATILAAVGKRTEAVYYAKLATALKLGYPEYALVPSWLESFGKLLMAAEENPVVDWGYRLIAMDKPDKAVEAFIDAIQLDAGIVEPWKGLVEASRRRHFYGDALKAAEAIVSIEPDDPENWATLAKCQVDIGQTDTAWTSVSTAIQNAGPDPDVAQYLPSLARYDVNATPEFAAELADAWDKVAVHSNDTPLVAQRRSQNDKFRVGILSGSIYAGSRHAPLLSTIEECIGRAAEIYYYVNRKSEDAVTRRLRRSAIRWRDISLVDDQTVSTMIRNDEVQVLIDLDGFDWGGRPGVIALKPAPVVLSVFADPGFVPGKSVGVKCLGEPGLPGFAGTDDTVCSIECGLSNWPLYVSADAEEQEAKGADEPLRILIDGPSARLSEAFLATIAGTIKGLDAVEFVLRCENPEDTTATTILAERLAAAGIDDAAFTKVDLRQSLESLLSGTDLVLDTFPVPSLEVSFAALRRGIPVLSKRPVFARNGAVTSLLSSIGLGDFVVETEADYATRLSDYLKQPETVRALGQKVRDAVKQAASLEPRLERGRAFAELFDRLLAQAASEETK